MILALVLLAHSWYPLQCCSGQDCFPLGDREVEEQAAGWRVRVTGEFIPRSQGQRSQDGRYHICRSGATWKVRCFFYPIRGV